MRKNKPTSPYKPEVQMVCSTYRDGTSYSVGVWVRRRENVWNPNHDPRVENNTACVIYGGTGWGEGHFGSLKLYLSEYERQNYASRLADINFCFIRIPSRDFAQR